MTITGGIPRFSNLRDVLPSVTSANPPFFTLYYPYLRDCFIGIEGG